MPKQVSPLLELCALKRTVVQQAYPEKMEPADREAAPTPTLAVNPGDTFRAKNELEQNYLIARKVAVPLTVPALDRLPPTMNKNGEWVDESNKSLAKRQSEAQAERDALVKDAGDSWRQGEADKVAKEITRITADAEHKGRQVAYLTRNATDAGIKLPKNMRQSLIDRFIAALDGNVIDPDSDPMTEDERQAMIDRKDASPDPDPKPDPADTGGQTGPDPKQAGKSRKAGGTAKDA